MRKVSIVTSGGTFFGEPTIQFDFECDITQALQSLLLDSLLRESLQPLLSREKELTNLKGRDAGQILNEETSPDDNPLSEGELMFVSGTLNVSEDKKKDFKIGLYSDFNRFEGSKNIVHTLREARKGSLPDFVPWYEMGRIFPVDITLFRVALEMFSPRRTWSFFGVMPSVTRAIYIDCSKTRLSLRGLAVSKEKDRKMLFDWDGARVIEERMSKVLGVKIRKVMEKA